jgi:hypothetical protein
MIAVLCFGLVAACAWSLYSPAKLRLVNPVKPARSSSRRPIRPEVTGLGPAHARSPNIVFVYIAASRQIANASNFFDINDPVCL